MTTPLQPDTLPPLEKNGTAPLPVNGFDSEAPDEAAREKGKGKKKLKKELKRRRELLERFPPGPVTAEPAQLPVEVDQTAPTPEKVAPRRLREWFRAASQSLDRLQIIAAQKSNTLIAVNCVILAAAALSASRVTAGSLQGWALIPLSLTCVLSLIFAITSAQVQASTTLDDLWMMPEDEYEHALAAIIGDKDHLFSSLRRDLHRAGATLSHRQKLLRTSYNVLLGGIPLSTLMFAICIAVASRS